MRLEEIWDKTGEFLAKGEGGYVVETSPNTQGYYPIDLNGNLNRDNIIVVHSEPMVEVAMMFWRPDASPHSIPVLMKWLKEKNMTIDQFNHELAQNILMFRQGNKETLFNIAKAILSKEAPKPVRRVKVEVTPVTKTKRIHQNKAVVGGVTLAIASGIIHYLGYVLPTGALAFVVSVIATVLAVLEHQDYNKVKEEIENG